MGTTPVESLVAAGNIFVGQVSWSIEKQASTVLLNIVKYCKHLCIKKKSSFHRMQDWWLISRILVHSYVGSGAQWGGFWEPYVFPMETQAQM